LLETLIDHPNRDEIIAKEMGWDKLEKQAHDDFDVSNIEFDESEELEEADESFSAEDSDEDALRRIPAYSASFDWSVRVHDALKPYLETEASELDESPLEEGLQATMSCYSIAAKIAGGDAIGYDDSLCGNIVCCKKALAFADESLQGLSELRTCGVIDSEILNKLIEDGQHVRQLVETRIEDLRSRVWWE